MSQKEALPIVARFGLGYYLFRMDGMGSTKFPKNYFSSIWVICMGLFLHALVYAGVENRPINTDNAFILDKGTFTASIGTVFTRADNGDKETDLNIDLGYGIIDQLGITMDIPIVFSDPKEGKNEEGLGDISIRPEFFLIKEYEYIPAVSFAYTIKTQSGSKSRGLGSGENDHSLSLQFSKDFSPLNFHFNLGYTFIGQSRGEAVDDIIFYNLASEYSLNDKLTLVGELIGDTNSDPKDSKNPLEALIGFIYSINNHAALDFGIGGGFNRASPDMRATIGLTYQY